MSKKQIKNIAIGAAIAGAVGYIAGVLTAPKSGKETREDIKVATKKGIAAAEKALKTTHTELSQLVETAKTHAISLKGKAKDELDALLGKANKAKEKARQTLSAAHDGEADDSDLQSAINEAEQAVSHLKKFLKK